MGNRRKESPFTPKDERSKYRKMVQQGIIKDKPREQKLFTIRDRLGLNK